MPSTNGRHLKNQQKLKNHSSPRDVILSALGKLHQPAAPNTPCLMLPLHPTCWLGFCAPGPAALQQVLSKLLDSIDSYSGF